jgi:hypothetical protein
VAVEVRGCSGLEMRSSYASRPKLEEKVQKSSEVLDRSRTPLAASKVYRVTFSRRLHTVQRNSRKSIAYHTT